MLMASLAVCSSIRLWMHKVLYKVHKMISNYWLIYCEVYHNVYNSILYVSTMALAEYPQHMYSDNPCTANIDCIRTIENAQLLDNFMDNLSWSRYYLDCVSKSGGREGQCALSMSNDLLSCMLKMDKTSNYTYHKSLLRYYNWAQRGMWNARVLVVAIVLCCSWQMLIEVALCSAQ